jgi:meiotic recombination protein DMC1
LTQPQSVANALRKNLQKIKGFSETKVDKVKEAVAKCMVSCSFRRYSFRLALTLPTLIQPNSTGFMNAHDYLQIRKKVIKISTGCSQLDKILGGGFQSMCVSEVYGEYRCGKTQICHTLCVACQLPKDMGGAEGKAVYIDTEGTFRPERIEQIAARYGVDAETAMTNILYARCENSEKQLELLDNLGEHFITGDYRLLIIDSVIACFRVDYQGRAELPERQAKLGQFLSAIKKIAWEFNVCVFLVGRPFSEFEIEYC